MADINENNSWKIFWWIELSFNRKTFRVQKAVDFQVSPEAVYITVSAEITAEVVSNTCGNEWMLEAIEKGNKFG